jgi:cytohesin
MSNLSKIFDAVRCGDVEKVRQLVHSHQELVKDSTMRNLLCTACSHGHTNVVRLLISLGADLRGIYHQGRHRKYTLLALAASNNHNELVMTLVREYKCDPNDGVSLHTAGHLGMVNNLICLGADVENTDASGNRPLHEAIRTDHQIVAQTLFSCYTCNPNAKNNQGVTPLHVACELGDMSMVRTLIEYGANTKNKDIHDHTPLATAVDNDHKETVSALVREFGCNPNDGIHLACRNGQSGMMDILVRLGAKGVRGNTPLHDVARKLFTYYKRKPSARTDQAITPLHIACELDSMSMVKTLIEYGGNLDNKDAHGYTPLLC